MTPSGTSRDPQRPTWRQDLAIGVLAMVIAAVLVLPAFFSNGGNPTLLLRVGTYAPARPYVERSLPDPVLTPDYGHDGQQFYVLASSLPDLPAAAPYVDNLRYRARRILFPLLASPFPDGPPMIWAMFAINLLAIGAGAVALARLARQVGAPPLVGLIVGASPAMLESLQGSLGDALAFGLALWGVTLWRRKLGWAVLLFTLAGLTRETSLVVPLACLIVGEGRQRLRLLVPFAVMVLWSLVELVWLPTSPSAAGTTLTGDITKALGVPFKGWLDLGLGDVGTLTALVLLVGCLIGARALWDVRRELSWWLLFDAILLIVSNAEVLGRPYNVARVAPFVLPGIALALTTRGRGRTGATRAAVSAS
jgi:hypothetical protein